MKTTAEANIINMLRRILVPPLHKSVLQTEQCSTFLLVEEQTLLSPPLKEKQK